MTPKTPSLTIAAAMLALLTAAAAAQNQPGWKAQGDLDLMAGQYFFENSAGSVNGYANGDLQLLRSFGSRSGFYLDAHSTYTGFKQVNELAGGGTLFQQSLDNSIGAKWIQRFDGGWSLKPRVGARSQLFRETTDEKWGKGLYDLWRYEAGVLLERKGRLDVRLPWSEAAQSVAWNQQLSYDAYYTHYPRFKSLASQFGTEQAAPDPGTRILDTFSHQLSYRSELDLPDFISASLFYSASLVQFTDQKVVDSRGAFPGNKRRDLYQSLNLGVSKRFNDWLVLGRVRPVAGVSFTAANLSSNQNHFDADPARLKFIRDYYGYWETRVTPTLTTTFLAAKTIVRIGGELASRYYTGRLAQEADGRYKSDTLTQYTETAFLEASQPLWRTLDLKLRASWSNASANTAFEQSYQYNYHDYNYFGGLGWRF